MPTKPSHIDQTYWDSLDEVARMRAAKEHEAFQQQCDEVDRLIDETLREIELAAAALGITLPPTQHV
jgi:hypothetical protein